MELSCTPASLVTILALLPVAALLGVACTLAAQAITREKRRSRQFAAIMRLTPQFTTETAAALMACNPKGVEDLIGRRLTRGDLVRNTDGSFSVQRSTPEPT